MPVFAYKGIDAGGKKVSGNREADNAKTIKHLLRREGVFPTSVVETGAKKKETKGDRKLNTMLTSEWVSTQDLAVATRQLATLLGAGISLVESLTALIDQVEHAALKSIWAAVKTRVNEGANLADALGEHKAFSPLYVNMVRAGESSGALDIVLERLADFTENQAALKSKVVGTMIYPVVMFVFAILVTAILFIFVIPKITKIFESQKMALPLPTQILIGFSEFITHYWWLVFMLAIVSLFGFRRYIKTEKGKQRWHGFLLQVPVFGPITRMVSISRFCNTLGTLLSSGVPLLSAFDIVKNVVQNKILVDVIDEVRNSVKEGESIAGPLKKSGQFPPMVTHMISVGEKSGALEEMLNNVARSYEAEVDNRLRAMTSLLEPLIIVIMGVVVASIVIAILLPILQMSSSI